jgi:hypothetical protein
MEFTCELSKLYSVTPFEIFKQDKDIVIMLVNYYIEKGQGNKRAMPVNDKTEKQSDRNFWAML